MDPSNSSEVTFEYQNKTVIRTYKDGSVERFFCTEKVPASFDPNTNVSSKDKIINPETGVSARLYLPGLAAADPQKKLPVLVYYHGGGFFVGSAFYPGYHNYLNTLVSQANIVVVSVDYRLAPENPIPAAYDDSWVALQWVASHAKGDGPEPWLVDHADFGRLFLAGDSAGANIAHNMAMQAGSEGLEHGVEIDGMVLVHPYFWGTNPVRSEPTDPEIRAKTESVWAFVCPSSPSNDDPRMNPTSEGAPSLAGLGCKRVLVCVAEKDFLRERGWDYYEKLGGSGWGGKVEMLESEGEDHLFYLFNPTCEKAGDKMKRLVSFFNHDQ